MMLGGSAPYNTILGASTHWILHLNDDQWPARAATAATRRQSMTDDRPT